MARRKAEAEPESSFDDIFDAVINEAKKKYPDQVYTGGEEVMKCICLPVPALSIRYLFQQEGLPMSRFILLDGPKESCKSSMAVEIVRWHRLCKGRGFLMEVEQKRSPDLDLSLLNYDHKALTVQRAHTLQEWNSALTDWVQQMQILMDGDPKAPKARPGKGRIAPVAYIVDSITSAVGDDTMEKVLDIGHTERHFASDAGLLSEYLKVVTKLLEGFPFTFVGVNHIKPGQDARGFPTRNMPGGKAPEYHASIDLEMRRNGKQWKTVNDEGVSLNMTVQKNSTAPHAELQVDMVWYIDYNNPTENGEFLQRTYFDWHTATWKMLKKFMADAGVETKKKLREILDFTLNEQQGKVVSTALEISDDDPLSFIEAGMKLEEKLRDDRAYAAALYSVLGIRRRPLYQPGVEFRTQMDEVRQEAISAQSDREKYVHAHPLHGLTPQQATQVAHEGKAVDTKDLFQEE